MLEDDFRRSSHRVSSHLSLSSSGTVRREFLNAMRMQWRIWPMAQVRISSRMRVCSGDIMADDARKNIACEDAQDSSSSCNSITISTITITLIL